MENAITRRKNAWRRELEKKLAELAALEAEQLRASWI